MHRHRRRVIGSPDIVHAHRITPPTRGHHRARRRHGIPLKPQRLPLHRPVARPGAHLLEPRLSAIAAHGIVAGHPRLRRRLYRRGQQLRRHIAAVEHADAVPIQVVHRLKPRGAIKHRRRRRIMIARQVQLSLRLNLIPDAEIAQVMPILRTPHGQQGVSTPCLTCARRRHRRSQRRSQSALVKAPCLRHWIIGESHIIPACRQRRGKRHRVGRPRRIHACHTEHAARKSHRHRSEPKNCRRRCSPRAPNPKSHAERPSDLPVRQRRERRPRLRMQVPTPLRIEQPTVRIDTGSRQAARHYRMVLHRK